MQLTEYFIFNKLTGLIAVVVSLLLPETRGFDSIETIEEAEYFYKHNVLRQNHFKT